MCKARARQGSIDGLIRSVTIEELEGGVFFAEPYHRPTTRKRLPRTATPCGKPFRPANRQRRPRMNIDSRRGRIRHAHSSRGRLVVCDLLDDDRIPCCLYRLCVFLKWAHVLKIQLHGACACRFERPNFLTGRAHSSGIGCVVFVADLLQRPGIRRSSQPPTISGCVVGTKLDRKLFARQHAYLLHASRHIETRRTRRNCGGPWSGGSRCCDVRNSGALEISLCVEIEGHSSCPNFGASAAAVAQRVLH